MSVSYQWKIPHFNAVQKILIKKLTAKLNLPTYLVRLLVSRKINSPEKIKKFLNPQLSDLDNPFHLHDMRKGLQIISDSIKNHERITIYGDYDVDGITSTSIMYLLLKHFGADVHYFIPNRFRDGYGPNLSEYKRIIKDGTKLLVTVDNGISGLQEITYARKHGMKVVITDHHDFPKELPPANAIIMAAYPGYEYHFTDFCGAGIAFKIAQAMLGKVPEQFLDLATLGTIADSVSLRSENRVIVAYGIKKIQTSQRLGIKTLAKAANVDLKKLNSTELSFTLIPRLNALGRMDDANAGVALMTTKDPNQALDIAQMTEQMNKKRQSIMASESKEALLEASTPENLKKTTLVLANRNWFPGVVGIIASRVINKFYKPTIVIGHLKADDQKNIDRGSGRSIPEFNLFKAMDPIRKDMTSFGGHPMACGLSIKPDKISQLRDDLEKAGKKLKLDQVKPVLHLDMTLTPNEISPAVLKNLRRLAPFGQDNQPPLIDLRFPQIYNLRTMGRTRQHLGFSTHPSYRSVHAVAWQQGSLFTKLEEDPQNIEVAGSLSINHYQGRDYLQLVVKHLRHFTPPITLKRTELGRLYKYFAGKRMLPFNDYGQDLLRPISQYLGFEIHKVKFAIKIFCELHLMRKTAHGLRINPHPQGVSLSDSPTYQKLQKNK